MGQQVPPYFLQESVCRKVCSRDHLLVHLEPFLALVGQIQVYSASTCRHRMNYLPAHSEDSHILVLYESHKNHVSLSLIESAINNFIILFVLPPHGSHFLQPLDVNCYGPFEMAWNAACHYFLRESGGNIIIKYDVCKIA